jgi:hypothetical protein
LTGDGKRCILPPLQVLWAGAIGEDGSSLALVPLVRLAILMVPTADADECSLATREISPDVMSRILPLRVTNKRRIFG